MKRRATGWLVIAGVVLVAWVTWLCATRARAQSVPAAPPTASATAAAVEKVTVGIWLNQVQQMSFKSNDFVADLYVWFRWRNEELKPHETFTFPNSRVESKGEVFKKKLADGTFYATVHVTVRVTHFWNVETFPLDRERVAVSVEEEEKESDALEYVADVRSSGVDPGVGDLPGWDLAGTSAVADVHTYPTDFGEAVEGHPQYRYARFTFAVELKRQGLTYAAKIFFGLWVAAAIAFIVFHIKPTNVDPRFGLPVGAIFAAVASEYIVASILPETNMLTLADEVHLVAFAFIFVTLVQSTISLRLLEGGREAASRRIDRICGWAVPLAYVALNCIIIAARK